MTTKPTLPIIDVGPFIHGSPASSSVVSQWGSAMQTYGLAHVVGHGVPDDVILEMQESARHFFALPAEKKQQFYQEKGYGPEGYLPPGQIESVTQSMYPDQDHPPDLVENFVFRCLAQNSDVNMAAEYPDILRERAVVYGDALLGLLDVVMGLTAAFLDLPPRFFDKFYQKPENHLRLASYPQIPNCNRLPGQFAYGEHTDYTGFTILKQDDSHAAALELKFDDQWIPVAPVPGAFVVNCADLIEIWTNGLFKSPVHRVVMPDVEPSEQPRQPRLSLVLFTGPSNNSLIEPIRACQRYGDGVQSIYSPVVAGEYLRRKLSNSNKYKP
jgi:isopenicillin N synthase-like dioxygenase